MADIRLPIPGEDQGSWGEILNSFLLVALNNDGTLRADTALSTKVDTNDVRLSNTRTPTDGTVTTAKVVDAAITNTKLSAAVQASLAKADSALQTQQVTSVAGKTGIVTLVKGDVGLGGVDNTSDDAKPVSSAAQAALNAKANTADLATVATTGSYNNLLNKPSIPDDATIVHLSDVQTITGAKDFTGGLLVSGQTVVATNDARLSNMRTPTDGTVTTAKVVDAAITGVKLSAAVQASLAKADSALQAEQITSVAGKTGVVSLVKGDVGLGNVDNTSDGTKNSAASTLTNKSLVDSTTFIVDDIDATKKVQFEVSGVTTATTRTLTVPDSNGTLYVSAGTDVSVLDGGTGRSTSTTAYGLIAAGTTATGAHQTIAPGSSGQFLKSAGTAALAAFSSITESDVSGLVTDLAAKQNASVVAANGMGSVVHGATATTARPTGFATVTWIGSVSPTNAVTNDIWVYKP